MIRTETLTQTAARFRGPRCTALPSHFTGLSAILDFDLRDGAALKGAQGDNNLASEQIKADKLRRCQEALKALAPDKPWPDICK